MKNIFSALFLVILTVTIISCNSSAEEQAAREQAIKDSLAQVKAQNLLKQRADSIAQALAAEEQAKKDLEPKSSSYSGDAANLFNDEGPVYVQVEAWRSQSKAESRLSTWKERGFNEAYVIEVGKAETGDIWYRIRLGKTTESQKEAAIQYLKDTYKTSVWVID